VQVLSEMLRETPYKVARVRRVALIAYTVVRGPRFSCRRITPNTNVAEPEAEWRGSASIVAFRVLCEGAGVGSAGQKRRAIVVSRCLVRAGVISFLTTRVASVWVNTKNNGEQLSGDEEVSASVSRIFLCRHQFYVHLREDMHFRL